MKQVVYVIGYPGSGKTSAMRAAVCGLTSRIEETPFKHTVYDNGTIEMGCKRDDFGGTDVLSFSVQPKVIQWLGEGLNEMVVGEGDRLANDSFFSAVQELGYGLHIVHIKVGELTALRRIKQRGSEFNPAWVRGRMTKVDGLTRNWRNNIVAIDGNRPRALVGEELRDMLGGLADNG
jgi:ribose 1,5-bisphosphokinase PhnN